MGTLPTLSRREFIKGGMILLSSTSSLSALASEDESDSSSPAADAQFDVQAFVDKALQSGRRRIVVPKGRYRVTPKAAAHLRFKDLTGIEIVAEGVEIICTQTVRAISFENCHHVRLKGITVDYDPLPFTEGRITAFSPDQAWLEFELIEGYPAFKQLDGRVEIFDALTGDLRRELPSSEVEAIESTGRRCYRLVRPKGYHSEDKGDRERIGDILVTAQRSAEGGCDHAIVAADCMGLTLEDVTLYASPVFGFLELRCDRTTYRRCIIDRRSPAEDTVKRGHRRLRSLNADAFHSIGAARGPTIVGCTARFQDDDCVNVHGIYHLVTGCHEHQLRVAAASGQLTIRAGDTVEFIPYEGNRPADAVALRIEPDKPISEMEKAFIQKRPMDEGSRRGLLGDKARFFKITLDRAVPLAMGAGVCSSAGVGNGCLVSGCDFGYNRSRGIVIKASKAKVVGNKIIHGWMTAVLVAPEFFWWLEAASGSDILVQGNTVSGCREPAIEVTAQGGNGKPLPSGAHRNVIIRENSINQSVWPNIHVTSCDSLVVKGNHLTPADANAFVPPLTRRWTWETSKPTPILVELCDKPEIQSASSKQ